MQIPAIQKHQPPPNPAIFTSYLDIFYSLEYGYLLKNWQKLMVIEGGTRNLGRWLSYKRNLYEDFKGLYGEEPRRLIFIGILNDTHHTGQEAISYIGDLYFHRAKQAD